MSPLARGLAALILAAGLSACSGANGAESASWIWLSLPLLLLAFGLMGFLEKAGDARETEAEARKVEAEARLQEAENEATRLGRHARGGEGA